MQNVGLQSGWPMDITRLRTPIYSRNLTAEQVAQLRTSPRTAWQKINLDQQSNDHIAVMPITSTSHPARGQLGLFARRSLQPDELVTVYLGLVHGESEADMIVSSKSDYDISLDRDIGVAVDAATSGNEGRFVNDYRGVPRQGKGVSASGPNADFRDVWIEYVDKSGIHIGERAMAIFVLGAGMSGKRKGGIKAGDEVLVSYGRGFWEERQREISREVQYRSSFRTN